MDKVFRVLVEDGELDTLQKSFYEHKALQDLEASINVRCKSGDHKRRQDIPCHNVLSNSISKKYTAEFSRISNKFKGKEPDSGLYLTVDFVNNELIFKS